MKAEDEIDPLLYPTSSGDLRNDRSVDGGGGGAAADDDYDVDDDDSGMVIGGFAIDSDDDDVVDDEDDDGEGVGVGMQGLDRDEVGLDGRQGAAKVAAASISRSSPTVPHPQKSSSTTTTATAASTVSSTVTSIFGSIRGSVIPPSSSLSATPQPTTASHTPTSTATTATATATAPALVHPLQDMPINTRLASTPSSATIGSSGLSEPQDTTAGTSPPLSASANRLDPPATATTTTSQHHQQHTQQNQLPRASAGFRVATSTLASTFTNFAKNAAHSIQSSADAAWQSAAASSSQNQPFQSQQQQPPRGGSGSSITTFPVPTQSSSLSSLPRAASSTQIIATRELDNLQKSTLVSSALGPLLPGERVIMFLSDLVAVRESCSLNTGLGDFHRYDYLGGEGRLRQNHCRERWCAAMTFYRLALFSYDENDEDEIFSNINDNKPSTLLATTEESEGDESKKRETENKGAASSSPPPNSFAQNPLDTSSLSSPLSNDAIDNKELEEESPPSTKNNNNDNTSKQVREQTLLELMEASSLSRQYQYHSYSPPSSSPSLHTNKHKVIQIPLASIDRVEKEYAPILTTTPSNALTTTTTTANIGRMNNYSGHGSTNYSGHGGIGINAVGVGSGGIGGIQQQLQQQQQQGLGLAIYGKDNGRQIRFATPSYGDAIRAHEALNTYAFPGRRNLGYLFAFESRRTEVMASIQRTDSSDGGVGKLTAPATRRRFVPLIEFERQGVLHHRQIDITDGKGGTIMTPSPWSPFVKVNAQYTLCQSYPSIIVGPASISETSPEGLRVIRQTAAFRSERRLPALTWGSKVDGASIWRCSQPKVGLQGNRSNADERYLRLIAESAANGSRGRNIEKPLVQFLKMLTGGIDDADLILDDQNNGCMLKILDLRPKTSAMANRTGGYGYENTSNYPNTTITFLNIGNIHAVRDSYQKLSSLCLNPSSSDVQWSQLVEDTKWLYQIRLILSASWQTAFHVQYNRLPVLLHCSHGWDRTSQVAALAQLLLDPFYRTREGFATLVEKDFLSFGHPFHTRCGHGEGRGERGGGSSGGQSGGGGGGDEGQIAPIFIQFLDCVYQIVQLFPEYFEFNLKYLLLLSEHVYSCRFGTLLCDTEREREIVAGIRQRTHCLWEYLESRSDLINPFFRREYSGVLMMPLPTLLRNVTLWVDRHCMYGPKPTLRCFPVDLASFYRSRCSPSEEDVVRSSEEIPLLGANEIHTVALLRVGEEAEKWKRIAEKKQKELDALREKIKGRENSHVSEVEKEEKDYVSVENGIDGEWKGINAVENGDT